MNAIEKMVLTQFGELGLTAERVEETDEKRPDFVCRDSSGQTYWIELKSKDQSEEEKDGYVSDLSEGKVAESVQVIERINSISGVIGDASNQLDAVAQAEDLRLVWLHAEGIDNDAMTDQIKASLYGLADLAELPDIASQSEPGEPRVFMCFFFTNSDFFLRRDSVDGVIVSNRKGFQLHVNPFSLRADKLRNSILAEALQPFDVGALDGEKGLMVADTDLDRKKQFGVLNYLRGKYNTSFLTVLRSYAYESKIAP